MVTNDTLGVWRQSFITDGPGRLGSINLTYLLACHTPKIWLYFWQARRVGPFTICLFFSTILWMILWRSGRSTSQMMDETHSQFWLAATRYRLTEQMCPAPIHLSPWNLPTRKWSSTSPRETSHWRRRSTYTEGSSWSMMLTTSRRLSITRTSDWQISSQ